MSPNDALVVHIAYGPLGGVIDPARLAAIRPDIGCAAWRTT
jgi:hypothetical protein